MSPERHEDDDARGKEKVTDIDDIPYFAAGNIDDEDDEVYQDGADEDFEDGADDDFDEDAFSVDEEDECDDDEEGMDLVYENPFEEEQGALLDFGDNPTETPYSNLEPLSLKDILPPGSKRKSRPDFGPASELTRQEN